MALDTMEHNIEVDIADFVAALTCSHRLSVKMLWFQIKNVFKY